MIHYSCLVFIVTIKKNIKELHASALITKNNMYSFIILFLENDIFVWNKHKIVLKNQVYIKISTMDKYSLNLLIWLTGGPGWFFVTIQHKHHENETAKALYKYTGHALQKLLKGLFFGFIIVWFLEGFTGTVLIYI